MVEASGYLFQDVEALLKRAKESMESAKEVARQGGAKGGRGKEDVRDESEIKLPEQTSETGGDDGYRKSLIGSMKKLDEICSRYKDDTEASLIRNKLAGFLEELDSGRLAPGMEGQDLERIIEEVHHLVEWRKLSTTAVRDLSLKSRRRTREDVRKR